METQDFLIPKINCGHCLGTIKRELGDIEGVSEVEGDANSKKITVNWDAPATLEKIKSTLKEIDYPAAE